MEVRELREEMSRLHEIREELREIHRLRDELDELVNRMRRLAVRPGLRMVRRGVTALLLFLFLVFPVQILRPQPVGEEARQDPAHLEHLA